MANTDTARPCACEACHERLHRRRPGPLRRFVVAGRRRRAERRT
jgi:predicted HNH restriction endonuclease